MGLLVARSRPVPLIGWLLLGGAVAVVSSGFADAWARYALLAEPGSLPGGRLAVLYDNASWPLLFAGVTAVALTFPDGRLPSPRWRWVPIAGVVGFGGALLMGLFSPETFEEPFASVTSPLPSIERSKVEPLAMVLLLCLFATMLAAVWAVRVRFRRATGIERLQLRWLAYGGAFIPAAVVVCFAEAAILGEVNVFTTAALGVTLTAIPVAVGVAVLRYRLYELDRLINRTAVYVALTALLTAAYAATTLVLGVALGNGSPWATAGATLAVAALFRPARGVVQRSVDRRLSPARYEGLRTVERFLRELRDARADPEATGATLAVALRDPSLELRYWLPESEVYADATGRTAVDVPGDPRTRTPIERAGARLGLLLHSPALAEKPDLLDSVVSTAGLAIEIARLRVEVRRQLALVEDSRTRILAARDAERHRLERDLHDGAQQRLVSIGLALRHVQHELGGADTALGDQLDATVAEIALAIEELRSIARGLRPAPLDDGLGPALAELATRAPIEVAVHVASTEPLGTEIETAAYFVASEALTNAIKHADATRVELRATWRDGCLVVSVADDGRGGAGAQPGSGLDGLRDRVKAHGGLLTIDSREGRGTTVTAELPCG